MPLPPNVKEINFKMLNEIYPTNELLRLKFIELYNCVFCEKEIEDLDHLFVWSELQSWPQSREIELHPLSEKTIKFGFFC